jgi:hypothetical protein
VCSSCNSGYRLRRDGTNKICGKPLALHANCCIASNVCGVRSSWQCRSFKNVFTGSSN